MTRKHRIIVGLVACMAGLLLLHRHVVLVGLPLFLAGFVLMNKR